MLLHIITIIHMLLIMFIALTPFFGSNFLLIIHFIIVPFIMLHWLINDNTCCLTVLEKMLSKDKNYKGVLARIIEPVYDFKKNFSSYSYFIYGITTVLWLITVYRLKISYNTSAIKELGFNITTLSAFLVNDSRLFSSHTL